MMEEIIRRVLEELKALEMNANTRKKMIVLSRNAASCETIRDRFKDTYEVVFVQNFTLEDRPDALLLKELTPEELVLLSEGKNGTLGPVLECLMKGKPVYLEETGLYHVRNRTTCPKALYSLYEKALKSLESYGVLVLKDEKRNRKLSLEKEQSGRILITESEVKKRMAAGEKVLYVSKRTMITPLAKDLMKENGIVAILQEGGEDHADR